MTPGLRAVRLCESGRRMALVFPANVTAAFASSSLRFALESLRSPLLWKEVFAMLAFFALLSFFGFFPLSSLAMARRAKSGSLSLLSFFLQNTLFLGLWVCAAPCPRRVE